MSVIVDDGGGVDSFDQVVHPDQQEFERSCVVFR